MAERVAIVDGLRTPMAKAGTALKGMSAADLGATIVRELMQRAVIRGEEIDEVIFGNVAQPTATANIARVIALKAGLPIDVPASTVHRNCASGMESITTAATKIAAGRGKVYLVGGVESMSTIPNLYSDEHAEFSRRLARSKTLRRRIATALSIRPRMFRPESGLVQVLTDPVRDLVMGLTAENLAREFDISREEQDRYALRSHATAIKAQESGVFDDEIAPIDVEDGSNGKLSADLGPRNDQTIERLASLRPYFDKKNGTVTVGNSSQVTDGAAAVLVMGESEARRRGLEPIAYVRDFAYASLEPERMGLGPVYAINRLIDRVKFRMDDVDYIELNEAFAAQVIACERASDSDEFARRFLGRSTRIGAFDRSIMNIHGGGISLGHPIGMTGTRIVLHAALEIRRQNKSTGLATLCVGGGQGAAILLEAA